MREINLPQLKQMRDTGEDFLLVNVLDPDAFDRAHIPGSENIPLSDPQFVEKVDHKAGARDRKIVVYCADRECDASPKAAKTLDEAGFTNVMDYPEGLKGWMDEGLPIHGTVRVA